MLMMYVVYCIALHYDSALESWVRTLPLPFDKLEPQEDSHLVTYKAAPTPVPENKRHSSYDAFNTTAFDDYHEPDFMASPEQQQPQPQPQQSTVQATPQTPKRDVYYKPKKHDPEERSNKLIRPDGGSQFEIISWTLLYPIHYLCQKTIPDCKTVEYRNWYPFTFIISVTWISFYSYIMVSNLSEVERDIFNLCNNT